MVSQNTVLSRRTQLSVLTRPLNPSIPRKRVRAWYCESRVPVLPTQPVVQQLLPCTVQVVYVESSGAMLRATGAPADTDLTGPLTWHTHPSTGLASAYLQVPDIEGFVPHIPKELHGASFE